MMIYKRLLLGALIFLGIYLPSSAEKIPVKLEPAQVLSTHHDEIQVGDWIKFQTAKDVYLNDALYIKKGTDVTGIVDYFHQNGWGGDSAEICFKKFYTNDINNNKVVVSYPLKISGNAEMATDARDVTNRALTIVPRYFFVSCNYLFKYIPFVIRGSEIMIEPDTRMYNIFIER